MTTPDTEKLLAKLAQDVGFVYITDSNIGWAGNYNSNLLTYGKHVMINTLVQIAEEIATMTDFDSQNPWEAGFDEAIYAVIVRIKEQMQNIVKETEN
jgi:hypothetical protein